MQLSLRYDLRYFNKNVQICRLNMTQIIYYMSHIYSLYIAVTFLLFS